MCALSISANTPDSVCWCVWASVNESPVWYFHIKAEIILNETSVCPGVCVSLTQTNVNESVCVKNYIPLSIPSTGDGIESWDLVKWLNYFKIIENISSLSLFEGLLFVGSLSILLHITLPVCLKCLEIEIYKCYRGIYFRQRVNPIFNNILIPKFRNNNSWYWPTLSPRPTTWYIDLPCRVELISLSLFVYMPSVHVNLKPYTGGRRCGLILTKICAELG